MWKKHLKNFQQKTNGTNGKVENVLKETDVEYGEYDIGDIVFVEKFNYSTGKKGEKHFFVIIEKNNIAIPIENFSMILSSQLDKLKYTSNKLLEKNLENGLNKDSIVKTDVMYKILNSQILFKIGKVDLEKINEYKESYYKMKTDIF